ncbi:hypothetical protein WMY93_013292 [Mugilogobius chulae]|uniref:Uncharacterized protein n=1 Tax=Mugilogobius chulae TaxID=88201 RepID=A0AAW0PBY6_9GOBI
MASISLAPNSHTATTSLASATIRPASVDISSPAEKYKSSQTMRSASTVPILAPVEMQEQAADSSNIDVEMEVEAIHESSQRLFNYSCGGAKQRAASVPIPQTNRLFTVDEIAFNNCNTKPSLSTVTVANIPNNKIILIMEAVCTQKCLLTTQTLLPL